MTRLNDGAMNLRDGCTVWQTRPDLPRVRERAQLLKTDIVIVGAGITGAFLAERFSRDGHGVVLIDRRAPATGSTAASTAMLLWELDASLLELEGRLGINATGAIAKACRRQVMMIGELVSGLRIPCDFAFRPSLYLSGNKLDAADLREEHRLREALGFEGVCLGEDRLADRGIIGEAALLYPFSAEVDPVKLTHGLLAAARARGAQMIWPATAITYETVREGVCVETQEGDVIRARTLVLANGYEMPDFVPAARHTIASTWAYATCPGAKMRWPGQAMLIWEASDPYLYLRGTADGRIVVGGADESGIADAQRSTLTPGKIRELQQSVSARLPSIATADAERAWSGAFGRTADSLPFIGPVPGRRDCLAAFGYGGNGITFSALAADLLAAELAGRAEPLGQFFRLDRD